MSHLGGLFQHSYSDDADYAFDTTLRIRHKSDFPALQGSSDVHAAVNLQLF